MARSVTFNGITRFSPGGITKINAAGLAQVTLSDNSIVGIVGEADGGASGAEGGLVTLFDPARARELFKSGPIVDALGLAFQSSNDPDVPGGASRVLVYKTNDSTASSLSLPAESTVLVNSAAESGTTTTLVDTVGLADYTLDDDPRLVGKRLVVAPGTAPAESVLITAYDATAKELTFTAITIIATQAYLIMEVGQVEVQDFAASGTTLTVVLANEVMVADEHIGRWMSYTDASGTTLRQITDNDTTTLTFSPALAATTVAGGYVQILGSSVDLTSKDWGEHTNDITVDVATGTGADTKVVTVTFEGEEEVSPDLGGKVLLKVLYKAGQTTTDTAKTAPTVPHTASSIEMTTAMTANEYAGTQVLINGEYTEVVSNTTSVITLSPALSAAPADLDDVSFRGTNATFTVGGAAGVATGLTTANTASPLAITFTTGQTLRQLLAVINADVNYEAEAGQGVNPDTTLVADLDYGTPTAASAQVTLDLAVEGATRNTMAVVDYLNDFSSFVSASRSAETGSTVSGCCPPADIAEPLYLTGGARGDSTNAFFQAGLDELLKLRCNSVVPLIDEDLTNEGFGSTATVASVAAQLAEHVAIARGTAQDKAGERGGFMGFQGTKDQVIAQANALNDQDVALVAQNPTVLNSLGSLEEFGPRMLAVMAASMRSGVTEVAEPLTHKLIRISGLTQDASWDPNDLTDANEMIINGLLFAEVVDGVGTRWVRDLTTWVADDNLAYSEGSVRDAVRYVAYGLRTTLVERFTGKKAAPSTIANVKDAANTFLETARQDDIIVDSTDPVTGSTVKAYHNLKVTSSGDTVRINVGIFPVPGINFQLSDIFLQLPTQSS